MLDFNHILSTPGYDVWYYVGSGASNYQWKTWTKPRGVSWIYALVVGNGGGGGCGVNTGTTSGGGGGGGSGAQASLLIPAMFFPDTVYVQCPSGGLGATTSGGAGTNNSVSTVINLEGGTSLGTNFQILTAGPGLGGNAGSAAAGGTGSAGGSASSIATCNLASKGHYTFLAGQTGTSGSTGNANAVTLPTTGLMVTGGGGGGSGGAGSGAGSSVILPTGFLGGTSLTLPVNGGAAAVTSTPAGLGDNGTISKNFLFNFGGAGGGGASVTTGGIAGRGGDGAPGCGGGGGGGMTTTNTTIARGGNGGPGFAVIISW